MVLRGWCCSFLVAACIALVSFGCGSRPPKLVPKVASPLGRPAVCAHCNARIETVTKANLITVDGIEYVVCDQKCAEELKAWLAEQ